MILVEMRNLEWDVYSCFPPFLKVALCCRYEQKCLTKMSYKMVEEKRPICKLEMMKSAKSERKKVMKCKLGMKKMKKKFPKSECRKVPAGQQEECVDMVKLQDRVEYSTCVLVASGGCIRSFLCMEAT